MAAPASSTPTPCWSGELAQGQARFSMAMAGGARQAQIGRPSPSVLSCHCRALPGGWERRETQKVGWPRASKKVPLALVPVASKATQAYMYHMDIQAHAYGDPISRTASGGQKNV